MADKTMTFGFILSAALSSQFSGSFARANRDIEKLSTHMEKMQTEADRMRSAFSKGIITEKTFNTALALKARKTIQSYGLAAKGAFNEAAVSAGTLYYKVMMIGSIFSAPIKSAMEFESAMADVKKVVDFDTPQQFKEMSNGILELSKRIPMTANELAQIVASGGQSGIAKGDLTSFAESAAKMGVAFDITADQAGDMMAKWRTAFKMSQKDVVDLADKVNYLGNTTAASAPLISDVVTRIGPLGEVGGVASGEIAALGASMVGSGIQSEVAATGIKNLILSLTAGESATKSQSEALNTLGLDAKNVAQGMQDDAQGTILKVLSAIQSLDKVQQASVLSQLFGKESLSAIAPLLSNLDGVRENFEKVADSAKYAGSMEGEFSARSATTANSLKLMKNRMESAQVAMGNGLLPVVTPLAEMMGSLATGVGNLASNYPELTRTTLVAVGAFTAVYGAINVAKIAMMEYNAIKFTYLAITKSAIAKTIIASTVSKASAAATWLMTAAQWALNVAMSANPIGAIIAAIVALIGVGYVFYRNWDEISSFAATMWEGAKTAISDFVTLAQQKITEAYTWITDKWTTLRETLSHPIDALIRYNTEQREIAQGGSIPVAQNAIGGIYNKGAFLTTFAENSPEAAIPINGSARSASLWKRTGEAMGLLEKKRPTSGNVSVQFSPNITIQGNADESVVRNAMNVTMNQLKNMLKDLQRNERRLSYE